jgi:putative redox protein
MSTSKIVYKGNLRCSLIHLKSAQTLITDAPTDNQGKGEAFSPTDLLATSLGACMLTIMGIYASQREIDISDATAEVTKIMTSDGPRRVKAIEIYIKVPKKSLSEVHMQGLINSAKTCPVALSLSNEIEQRINFEFVNS